MVVKHEKQVNSYIAEVCKFKANMY